MIDFTEIVNRFFDNTMNNGGGKFASIAIPVSFDLDEILTHCLTGSIYYYFNKPEESKGFAACGSLLSVNVNSKNRMIETGAEVEAVMNKFASNWQDYGITDAPLFVGGMKFASGNKCETWNDYDDSDWFVPQVVYYTERERSFAIFNFDLSEDGKETATKKINRVISALGKKGNESTHTNGHTKLTELSANDYDIWEERIYSLLELIAEKRVQKVVLSREVEFAIEGTVSIKYLLNKLTERYPDCFVFAFRKNESVFLGASPERLAKISDGWVEADALAGSIPRGETEQEDEKLASDLLHSKKNLSEQDAVVKFIIDSVKEFSDEIIFTSTPNIRKLRNIQHLWTPIRAKLKRNKSLFDILKGMHPTPAICGVPWATALMYIKAHEEHNRGLYAGVTGWFNHLTQGEYIVAIRSALIKRDKLYAYAGCGIVEGSDAELEYEETKLKLKPILSLFSYENTYKPEHNLG